MCSRRSRMMSNGLDAESGPSRHVGSKRLVARPEMVASLPVSVSRRLWETTCQLKSRCDGFGLRENVTKWHPGDPCRVAGRPLL